ILQSTLSSRPLPGTKPPCHNLLPLKPHPSRHHLLRLPRPRRRRPRPSLKPCSSIRVKDKRKARSWRIEASAINGQSVKPAMILHTRARRLLNEPGIFSRLSEPVLKAKATRSTNRDPTIKSRPSVFCPISRFGFPFPVGANEGRKTGTGYFCDRYCNNTRSGLAPPTASRIWLQQTIPLRVSRFSSKIPFRPERS